MPNLHRRNAFTRAFAQHPAIIMSLVESDDVTLVNPITERHEIMMTPEQQHGAAQVFMAQFFTRMIVTRCHKASVPLDVFKDETVKRYHEFTKKMIGGFAVYADDRVLKGLHVLEQNMSDLIFQSLATEANIHEQPDEETGEMPPPFDEFDFWADVFLSFAGNSRPKWPRWNIPAQEIFLDAKDDFIAATREFPQ